MWTKDASLEKLMVQKNLEGKRPQGRSPIRYADHISEVLGVTIRLLKKNEKQ